MIEYIIDNKFYETRIMLWDEYDFRIFTCDECMFRYMSEKEQRMAWENPNLDKWCWTQYDSYNTNGDCLMEK